MRFDLGESKEFNFHFVFQLGETCKTADATAAFPGMGGRWGFFFLEPSRRVSFQGENSSWFSAPLLSTAETWTGYQALSRTFNPKLSPVNIMDTEYLTPRNDGGLSPL